MFLETARLEREDWQEERCDRAFPAPASSVVFIRANQDAGGEGACETEGDEQDDSE